MQFGSVRARACHCADANAPLGSRPADMPALWTPAPTWLADALSPSCGSGGKRGRTSAHVYMMFCAGDDKLVVIDYSTT